MMIIKNVPYIEDKLEKFASCQGPPSVLMVFRYFLPKERMSFQRLYKELNYPHATWFFETYITRFFHKFKIPVKYYSTRLLKKISKNKSAFLELTGENPEIWEIRDEVNPKNYDSSVDYVLAKHLFEQKEITFDFIKSELSKNKLAIATINRNKLTCEKGFVGHFIVIKGFDEKGFICNDAFLGENIKISYPTFKESFYTTKKDETGKLFKEADIVFIG